MAFVQLDLNASDDCVFFYSIVFFNLISSYSGVVWGSLGTSLFLELIVILLTELLSFRVLREGMVFWTGAIPSSSSLRAELGLLSRFCYFDESLILLALQVSCSVLDFIGDPLTIYYFIIDNLFLLLDIFIFQ